MHRKMAALVHNFYDAEATRTAALRKWFSEYTQLVQRWNSFVPIREAVDCAQVLDTGADFKAYMIPRYTTRELSLVCVLADANGWSP